MSCPSCGAPLSCEEGKTKITCHYCSMVTVLQPEGNFPNSIDVSVAMNKASTLSQKESRELKLNQELTLLQMNLTELREQRERLMGESLSANQNGLQGIQLEEITLNNRIAAIQDQLALEVPPPIYQAAASIGGSVSNKSWGTTLFLACTLGSWGVHRFYSGNIPTGLLQLFTLGGCGVWVFVDIIMILTDNFKDGQGRPLNRAIKANPLMMKLIGGFILWFAILVLSMPQDGSQPSDAFMSFLLLGVPLLLVIIFNLKKIIGWFKKKKI